MQLSLSTREALGRVARSEPLFVEWLKQRREEHLASVAGCVDQVHLRWLQGRVQEADQILALLDNAAKS